MGLAVAEFVAGDAGEAAEQSMTAGYSQKTLLKNWALSVCLALIA
ncbi:hypothetical protein HZU77_013065 [Neisseriaceae bacterium TC5R-5]|nr:hypothetical protein [Neisseriaceae bacterium TC5R-5]